LGLNGNLPTGFVGRNATGKGHWIGLRFSISLSWAAAFLLW
jgi:hypothetical protein